MSSISSAGGHSTSTGSGLASICGPAVPGTIGASSVSGVKSQKEKVLGPPCTRIATRPSWVVRRPGT